MRRRANARTSGSQTAALRACTDCSGAEAAEALLHRHLEVCVVVDCGRAVGSGCADGKQLRAEWSSGCGHVRLVIVEDSAATGSKQDASYQHSEQRGPPAANA